jgi:hypothetical protein
MNRQIENKLKFVTNKRDAGKQKDHSEDDFEVGTNFSQFPGGRKRKKILRYGSELMLEAKIIF